MHCLLNEPVIPITHSGTPGVRTLSLPELLADLAADRVDSFPGLRSHQAPAWYRFLAQLAAIALNAAAEDTCPVSSAKWRRFLTELAPEEAGFAWRLVADPDQPGFLQPPTKRIADYRPFAVTPDELDVLVTAKNHDRKQSVAAGGGPQYWLYSLVSLQTTQGYSGSGQPGIARMNGGFSSRPLVDLRPGPRWGGRFTRAVSMLLRRRDAVWERVDLFRPANGLALAWLRAWDDDGQLQLQELDPYFIEVCRRVRLVANSAGRIHGVARPAKKPRTNAKAFLGNLGDPWVPIDLRASSPRALTVGDAGFDYRLTRRILFSQKETEPALAVRPLPGEETRDCELHLAALVRGQGRTDGFHERVIPLPRETVPYFDEALGPDPVDDPDDDDGGHEPPESLADLSRSMVERAAAARTVLRQALVIFLQGPDNPDFRARPPFLTRFDRRVDDEFFGCLFAAPGRGWERAHTGWQVLLRDLTRQLAEEAWMRLSAPIARREKARAAAERRLHFGLRHALPGAYPDPGPSQRS